MKKLLLSAACGAALLGGVAAAADELAPAWSWSGSVVGTSDYVFRGVSQTLGDATMQVNARVDHESGFYAGLFFSGVNFGDGDTDLETDIFAGYVFPLAENFTLDVSAVYYTYPGSEFGSEYDYFEGVAVLTYDFDVASINLKGAISPEFFGKSGTAEWLGAGVAIPITDWLSASGNVGYQWVDDNAVFLLPDYFHYDAGVTISFNQFALDLRWMGTDLDGTDDEFVGTISFAL